MTDEEFRGEIRAVIRRHDPDPEELRDLADALGRLADRYEAVGEVL